MTTLAIDFYGITPDPQAVKAAGYSAVLFYLRNPADPRPYLEAGLGVGTIFEYLADESLQGAAKGTADGKLAGRQMNALGQPAGTLHTVNLADFAPTPDELPAIEAYWQAYVAETAAWHVVPYGTGWLAEAANLPEWQNAMNDNGVLGSIVVPQAVIYQRVQPTLPQIAGTNPGDYDEDVILTDLPWWGLDPPPPPSSFHLSTTKDEPMFVAHDSTNQYLILATGKVQLTSPADGSALTNAPPSGAGLPYVALSTAQLAAIPNA